uniref:Uncharacterized protein n=1 Tax=Magnetococcus massalia (strain MO-1) TaxID=451514 RepID=A0A1S7LJF2_MAGMO|nr:conserved protein of unknown function [Candidatus Magnetococcus massalia]
MINPVQNVMVFGLLSAFQKEVMRDRERRDIVTEDGLNEEAHHVEGTTESNQSPQVRPRQQGATHRAANEEPIEAIERVVKQDEMEQEEDPNRAPSGKSTAQVTEETLELIRSQQIAEDVAAHARVYSSQEHRRQQLDRATNFLMQAMRETKPTLVEKPQDGDFDVNT